MRRRSATRLISATLPVARVEGSGTLTVKVEGGEEMSLIVKTLKLRLAC